jgi:hypothetical protein
VIIVRLSGGLGNQMFQYAAGHALSVYHHVSLLLDVGDFAKQRWHNGFELERIFSCPVKIADSREIHTLLGWQSWKPFRNRMTLSLWRFLRNGHIIVEPNFHYWPGILDVTIPCYLTGYWQSERYFANVEKAIRAIFTFRQPLSRHNREIAHKISEVNAVSLHVRRGDYAGNPTIFVKHGLCPVSYYEKAVEYICKHVTEPHFFVFSDDMDWVKKNLNIAGSVCYVDYNRGSESYNDMRLMSMCRHHIIANSTFSWWGAWLNPVKTKIVVAPKRWFHDCSADTGDLFPEGWITL